MLGFASYDVDVMFEADAVAALPFELRRRAALKAAINSGAAESCARSNAKAVARRAALAAK